jgi:hypothetical protein
MLTVIASRSFIDPPISRAADANTQVTSDGHGGIIIFYAGIGAIRSYALQPDGALRLAHRWSLPYRFDDDTIKDSGKVPIDKK